MGEEPSRYLQDNCQIESGLIHASHLWSWVDQRDYVTTPGDRVFPDSLGLVCLCALF